MKHVELWGSEKAVCHLVEGTVNDVTDWMIVLQSRTVLVGSGNRLHSFRARDQEEAEATARSWLLEYFHATLEAMIAGVSAHPDLHSVTASASAAAVPVRLLVAVHWPDGGEMKGQTFWMDSAVILNRDMATFTGYCLEMREGT